MKIRLCISLIITFILTIDLSLLAQDQIKMRDGTLIEGRVTYSTNNYNDLIKVNDQELDAEEIDRIIFGSGVELISEEISYYNTDENIEISKFVMLEIVLDGDAQLYSYKGSNFDFALKVNGKINALQQLPPNTETEQVQTYKIVLLVNLEQCAPRAEIFNTLYSRNSFINLVNSYNKCKNGDYQPYEMAEEKTRIFFTGFSVGLNHAMNDLLLPLADKVNGNPSLIGRVDQSGVSSNNLLLSFFVKRNILTSRLFYFRLGLNYRRYNFSITSFDSDVEVEDLKTNEIDFNFGLSLKPFITKKISPEISTGLLYSSFVHNKNIYHNVSQDYPAIPSNYIGNAGIDYFLELSIYYKLVSNVQLFFSGSYLFRTGEGMISRNGGIFYFDEDLYNNYTLSIGISLESIQSGIY